MGATHTHSLGDSYCFMERTGFSSGECRLALTLLPLLLGGVQVRLQARNAARLHTDHHFLVFDSELLVCSAFLPRS